MINSEQNILEIDLNESFIITEPSINYIIIDCEEYKHYTFINYDVFVNFIKMVVINDNNYYKLLLTKKDYTVTYIFNTIDKIIYYIYNCHTKKINN